MNLVETYKVGFTLYTYIHTYIHIYIYIYICILQPLLNTYCSNLKKDWVGNVYPKLNLLYPFGSFMSLMEFQLTSD